MTATPRLGAEIELALTTASEFLDERIRHDPEAVDFAALEADARAELRALRRAAIALLVMRVHVSLEENEMALSYNSELGVWGLSWLSERPRPGESYSDFNRRIYREQGLGPHRDREVACDENGLPILTDGEWDRVERGIEYARKALGEA